MWCQWTILSPNVVHRVIRAEFLGLFGARRTAAILTACLGCRYIALHESGYAGSADGWPSNLGLAFVVVGSFVFHEFGHAAALKSFGEAPGRMGLGMYGALPVLFTDVSAVTRLTRWKRLVVDLGGLYFQGVYGALVAIYAVLFDCTVAVSALLFIDLSILMMLNPFLRMDGYWLMSDAIGQGDLWRLRDRFWNENHGFRVSPKSILIYAIAEQAFWVALPLWVLVRLGVSTILDTMRMIGEGIGSGAWDEAVPGILRLVLIVVVWTFLAKKGLSGCTKLWRLINSRERSLEANHE